VSHVVALELGCDVEGAHGHLGHRIDNIRCDELLYVQHDVTPDRDAGAGRSVHGACAPVAWATSASGISVSTRRRSSTVPRARIRSWMASVTSRTLTFIPATTRSSRSQNARNSRLAGSPRNTTRSQRCA